MFSIKEGAMCVQYEGGLRLVSQVLRDASRRGVLGNAQRIESCRIEGCRVESCRVERCRIESCRKS